MVLTPEDWKLLLVSVGTHRGDRALSPLEVARRYQTAIDGGLSPSDCGERTRLQATQVGRFLALLNLPQDLQDLVDWGKSGTSLGFSAAFELSRLTNVEDQREGVAATLEYGLTTSETRQLVQARKRSGLPMVDCVAGVLRMRPHTDVRHVFIGAITDSKLRQRLQGMSQQARDTVLRSALKRGLNGLQVGGRLGPDRFTLSGGADFAGVLREGRDKLEARVNAELKREAEA